MYYIIVLTQYGCWVPRLLRALRCFLNNYGCDNYIIVIVVIVVVAVFVVY